jgi:hypothetical protein
MATCTCGAEIPPQEGRHRPRKKCVKCSPPRKRPPTVPRIGLPDKPSTTAPRRSIATSTLSDLQLVDRHETTAGITALHLADLIDGGRYNAQGAASLVKAHREALALALEGTQATADVIDLIFGAG